MPAPSGELADVLIQPRRLRLGDGLRLPIFRAILSENQYIATLKSTVIAMNR
jgi:hypothetical protein